MRSLNFNVNVFVSLGNDLVSVLSYACNLLRSCIKPQLRSFGALQFQPWQMQRHRWMAQPVAALAGNAAARPATATPVITGSWPVTG